MLDLNPTAVATNRRSAPRISVDLGATVHKDSVFFGGRIVDISEGGVRLATSCAFDPGGLVALAFPLDGELVMVRGEVRWNESGTVGIAFSYMSPFDRAMIKAFCRKRAGLS